MGRYVTYCQGLLAVDLRCILSYCADVRLCVSVTVIGAVKRKQGKVKALPVQAYYRPGGFLKFKVPRFRYGTWRWHGCQPGRLYPQEILVTVIFIYFCETFIRILHKPVLSCVVVYRRFRGIYLHLEAVSSSETLVGLISTTLRGVTSHKTTILCWSVTAIQRTAKESIYKGACLLTLHNNIIIMQISCCPQICYHHVGPYK
jgi:hypothetical protein